MTGTGPERAPAPCFPWCCCRALQELACSKWRNAFSKALVACACSCCAARAAQQIRMLQKLNAELFWYLFSLNEQLLAGAPPLPRAAALSPSLPPSSDCPREHAGFFPKVGMCRAVLLLLIITNNNHFIFTDRSFFTPPPTQGNKCVFNMCRGCCKKRAFKETADCPGKCCPCEAPGKRLICRVYSLL